MEEGRDGRREGGREGGEKKKGKGVGSREGPFAGGKKIVPHLFMFPPPPPPFRRLERGRPGEVQPRE